LENQKFIKDFSPGQAFDQLALVKRKSLLTAKNGKPYLALVVMDKSGEIDVKVWEDATREAQKFEEGDVLAINGKTQEFQGKIQLIAEHLNLVPKDQVSPALFLPQSKENIEELTTRIRERFSRFENPFLRQLLSSILDDTHFVALFKKAPAAMSMHHAYVGGLVQHISELLDLIDAVCPKFPFVEREKLLAGGFFHDIGKVYELSSDTSFNYTTAGKLIGHITMGVELITQKVAQIDGFPKSLAMELKHFVLSHHGEYEYGSPKLPSTIEAYLLHMLDNLSSKMARLKEEVIDNRLPHEWSPFIKMFQRDFFRSSEKIPSESGKNLSQGI
jgi:3'-5' exoribonuclease